MGREEEQNFQQSVEGEGRERDWRGLEGAKEAESQSER